MSGTSQVASTGKPVRAMPGWPAGVLDLVNDPLRTDGWNPWFSEMANDVNFYEFRVRDTDEVNHLIQKLAAIKTPKVQVQLNPGKEATYLGYSTVLKKGNGTAFVFSVGDQEALNAWYQRLPEVEPGVRKIGKWEFKQAPTASPPRVIIYAGNDAIDLKKLIIPPAAEVSTNRLAAAGDDPPNRTVVKAIENFIANRQSTTKIEREPELKFLSDVPEFREFNLKLTEERLKELINQHHLFAKVQDKDGYRSHQVFRSDGENVIIGFRGGECAGVQRMRREVEGLAKSRTAGQRLYK